jgi:hypothetical protein
LYQVRYHPEKTCSALEVAYNGPGSRVPDLFLANITLLNITDLFLEVVFFRCLPGQALSSDATGAGASSLAQIVDAATLGDDRVDCIVKLDPGSFRHAWNGQSFRARYLQKNEVGRESQGRGVTQPKRIEIEKEEEEGKS